MNNVRQLAVGLANYEASYQRLPIGLRSFDAPRAGANADPFFGMTWITRILPFAEQNALWDQATPILNVEKVLVWNFGG
jgi:hypothetical protein